MKMNKVFVFLIALAFTSLVLGNLIRRWVFLVGTISTMALFVIAARSLPPKDIRLEIEREISGSTQEIYVNDELEITIRLENRGENLRFLEVHDVIPSMVDLVEGSNHEVMSLDMGEEKELKYRISFPVTGKVDLGPVRTRYRDSFGFFTKMIGEEKEITIRVLPSTEKMESVDVNPNYTKHWLGEIRSKSIGVGSEFFSLREYHPGDEMRDLNWKATAKYFEPFTNEYEGEKSGDVILVVDGYEDAIVGTKRNNSFKASVDAAASLASSILSARNRVGLVVSGEYLNWVYPATGKNQYHKILANLTKFEEGGTWDLEDIRWLFEDFFPTNSMIIFISPLTLPKFGESIIDLCRKEYDVMVISPDPVKIEKEIGGEHEETVERLYKTERKYLLKRLWDHGALVVDWDPYEPIEPELEEVLRYRRTAPR